MTDYEQAKIERDRGLRWRLLSLLHEARNGPMKGLSGPMLLALGNKNLARDMRVESEAHAISLLRDLVNRGYATEKDERRFEHQFFALEHLFYRITDKGSAQAMMLVPVDPMLRDGRIAEEE